MKRSKLLHHAIAHATRTTRFLQRLQQIASTTQNVDAVMDSAYFNMYPIVCEYCLCKHHSWYIDLVTGLSNMEACCAYKEASLPSPTLFSTADQDHLVGSKSPWYDHRQDYDCCEA